MTEINFVQTMHASTKRNYVQRVVEHDKAESAEVARQWGRDYWDGERRYGYGGYHYDGRWRPLAQTLIDHYGIKGGMSVLDVGCGKGYLLHEFKQILPDLGIAGIDISSYGVENATDDVRPFLRVGSATELPYPDHSFDLVISLGMLHNLALEDVFRAVPQIERVGRGASKYLMVESFRNEREKANLLYWQLTCLSFHGPETWAWIYHKCGYTGDHGFIFFE
jgi:SAM-dependent methyltransferase